MKPAIKVENLSKQYRLGSVGTGTFSHDVNRWWHTVRGKEDPYLKIGESNDRTSKGSSDYVWAMKDINFEVKPGEVLGIIGKNGAGKSTLLKLLSRVTAPTTGSIKAKGRIASLLEVGTGFHPELTGRENVFLNGAIMGMSKQEIRSKFDEIVDFAGCQRYIDTPVKRYSSGMYVRLAFAVAAHLEPEILIVDEVLAVGDAEFQKKAIGKMKNVSSQGGRTVLFVSHNMASIQNLCTKVLVLKDGKFAFWGNTEEGINYYLTDSRKKVFTNLNERNDRENGKNLRHTNIELLNNNDEVIEHAISGGTIKLKISFTLKKPLRSVAFRVVFSNIDGQDLFLCNNAYCANRLNISEGGEFNFIIPKLPLPEGEYFIQLSAYSEDGTEDDIEGAMKLFVDKGNFFNTGFVPIKKDGVFVEHYFEI
ncbi:ABC transporter, ATP-binding protein [Formosa agariphila KMM 3901]|uniref:ABC transporter, ATP-binding protein n=1 Tax=Formosa agariphila (strain DSM 15362 / KCTC 12365 / LMG 23005 / KMM 3901 / M-2Alg 35-1) TaxID=1347342 RepID=T2KP60_FORAG|nr:ABC transporter ATP-binding protein [Formosa agariphila]CDF80642.1 ABC transporter, ATP-binding protein [Formosa agariphila KMM 3901]